MKFGYGAVRTLAAAAIFLIAGCSGIPARQQEDERVYREIAAQLNTGGTSYGILNSRNVIEGAERVATELYSQFSSMPEPMEHAEKINKIALHAALAWHLSGLEDIQGYGSSSILISDDGEEPRYRNRAFLMVRPDSKGVLWAVPGKNNRPLAPGWEQLPAGVNAASEIDLNPGDALRILEQSKTIAPYLRDERVLALLGDATLDKLLDGFAGTIRGASIPAGQDNPEAIQGYHMMFSLPDTDGKLAGLIHKFSGMVPGVKAEGERVELPPLLGEQAPEARPVILLSGKRVTIYSSVSAEKMFANPEKTLAASAEFQRFAAGLPAEGIGYVYGDIRISENLNLLLEAFDVEFRLREDTWDYTQLSILQRVENGFLVQENSTFDGNQQIIVNQILVPIVAGVTAGKQQWDKKTAASPAAVKEEVDTTAECQIKLEQFKGAFAQYAAANDGAFPAKEGIEGIRELLGGNYLPLAATICPGASDEDFPALNAGAFDYENCSYLYFGGFKTDSGPKLPLIVDWPYNHRDAINVLLVDGTIEKLELETTSCKRIVGKLQAMYHYSEKEFRDLIRQADAIDKLFELE